MTRSQWLTIILCTLVILAVGCGFHAAGVDLRALSPGRIRDAVLQFGWWAPVVYLAAFIQPIVPLPASVMIIAGGLAFGPAWGLAASLAGATIRAAGQFALARAIGRDAVTRWLKGQVASLNTRLGANAFQAVLLIRLIPNFPFDIQNYGLGVSRVKFAPFLLATPLGLLPGSFALVYLGYSLTDPAQLWKLGLAILLIVGLMAGQRALQRRRAVGAGS